MTSVLFFAAIGWPFFLLAACLSGRVRKIMPRLLGLAPLPALALAVSGEWNVPVWLGWQPYRATFELDASGATLLGAASALWIAAGFYAPAFFRRKTMGGSFVVCWLATLIGSLGVFLTSDLMAFLVFYALVSLPAYGLITHDGTPDARRAGSIYMGFALLGENLLLLAFVLLAFGLDSTSAPVLALLILGFGMKIALLPMHFWMPLCYTAAPIPAAAVLSGAAVKAGVIGLLRFLPFDTALPVWGETLTLVGFCGAFYGAAVGLTQTNPKTVLAYSSVSQMGFLAAVLGMGLSAGDAGVIPLAAFYAAHHLLVKGGLFLAVGAVGARLLVLAPAALIALGLAGLPLTGGALAKLAVKDPLGYGIAATLASLSAAGTALLMMHFLFRLAATRTEEKSARPGLVVPWLAVATLCVVFPWLVFPVAGLTLADIVDPAALWKTCWPVALGVLFAFALRSFVSRLPRIPAGDVVAWGGGISRAAAWFGKQSERLDGALRLWPVACCSLLLAAVFLAVAFFLKT
jgi:multicomponent Na+:H+ antiporter subunit A